MNILKTDALDANDNTLQDWGRRLDIYQNTEPFLLKLSSRRRSETTQTFRRDYQCVFNTKSSSWTECTQSLVLLTEQLLVPELNLRAFVKWVAAHSELINCAAITYWCNEDLNWFKLLAMNIWTKQKTKQQSDSFQCSMNEFWIKTCSSHQWSL